MGRRHSESGELSPVLASELAAQAFPVVTVPFYERPVVMRLRRLSSNQVKTAIGDVNLNWGPTRPGNGKNKGDVADAVTLLDIMDRAARAVMVDPSYDDFIAEIDSVRDDGARQTAVDQIDEIRERLKQFASADDPEVIALQAKADELRTMECFPLPGDTYGFLFSFAVGADGVDMTAYTESDAMSAAAMGERFGKRPSEIVGINPEKRGYLAENYDKMATVALERFRKEHRDMKKRGHVGALRRG